MTIDPEERRMVPSSAFDETPFDGGELLAPAHPVWVAKVAMEVARTVALISIAISLWVQLD